MLSFELGLHVILANASIYVALQTDLSLRWDDLLGSRITMTDSIIPSGASYPSVISQIPLMVSRVSVKSEDLFERQRVTAA